MKKRKPMKYGKFLLAVLLIFFNVNFILAANIGISPASVSFENVLRGGYSERIIVISVDSETPVSISLKPRGEITDWLRFSENNFSLSKNNPYFLKVFVEPPEDIPNGDYSGFLRVETGSFGSSIEDHAVGKIRSSLDLAISVEITDVEVIKCTAKNFEIFSAEQGDDVILKMNILNEGNVRINPSVLMDIWDGDQISIVESEEFVGEEVFPSVEKNFEFRMNSKYLDLGQYWSDVSVLECVQSQTLTFDILEEGALSASGILLNILTKGSVSVGETSAIIANFKNTGEKEISAWFEGKITRSGRIVEILESEKFNVPVENIESFNFYFTPKKEGKYIVSGRVFYDRKKTFETSAVLEVIGSNFSFVWVVYLVFMVLVGFLFFKIRQEKRSYLNRLRSLK